MSTVYMAIENITDEYEAEEGVHTQVYSVVDNMQFYQVEIRDEVYEAIDREGNELEGEFAETLINQVIEFQKGEK